MTPQEALTLIGNIDKEFAGKEREAKLVAACNTIALEAPKWALQALSRDKKLFDKMQAQIDEIKQALFPGGMNPQPTPTQVDAFGNVVEAPAPEEQGPSVNDAGERVGMDGKPLTPEEAAREAAMDAAIAGGVESAQPVAPARAPKAAPVSSASAPAAAPPPPQAQPKNGPSAPAPKA